MAGNTSVIFDSIMSGNEDVSVIPDSSSLENDVQISPGNHGDDHMEQQNVDYNSDDSYSIPSFGNSDSESLGGEIWSNSDSDLDSRISSSTPVPGNTDTFRPEVICIDDSDSDDNDVVCVADLSRRLYSPEVNSQVKKNTNTQKKDKIAPAPSSTVVSGALSLEEKYSKILQEVLPDADLGYLREEAAKIDSTEDLHFFINKAVSEDNYPKISKTTDGNIIVRSESKTSADFQTVHPSNTVSVIRSAPSSSDLKDTSNAPKIVPIKIIPNNLNFQSVPSTSGSQQVSNINSSGQKPVVETDGQWATFLRPQTENENRYHYRPLRIPLYSLSSSTATSDSVKNHNEIHDMNHEVTNLTDEERINRRAEGRRINRTGENYLYRVLGLNRNVENPSNTAAVGSSALGFPSVREVSELTNRVKNAHVSHAVGTAAEPIHNASQNELPDLNLMIDPRPTGEFVGNNNLQNYLYEAKESVVTGDNGRKKKTPIFNFHRAVTEPSRMDNGGPTAYRKWLNILMEVFPDADRGYLLRKAHRVHNFDDLRELILQIGENYPKIRRNDPEDVRNYVLDDLELMQRFLGRVDPAMRLNQPQRVHGGVDPAMHPNQPPPAHVIPPVPSHAHRPLPLPFAAGAPPPPFAVAHHQYPPPEYHAPRHHPPQFHPPPLPFIPRPPPPRIRPLPQLEMDPLQLLLMNDLLEDEDMNNVPGLVNNVPGLVNNVPGLVNNVPGLVNNVPGHMNNVPGHMNNVPGHMNNAPGHMNNAPGHLNNAPGHLNNAPGHLNNAPGHLNNAPGHLNNAPGHMNYVPGHMNYVPGHMNNIPRLMNNVPRLMNNVPRLVNNVLGLMHHVAGPPDDFLMEHFGRRNLTDPAHSHEKYRRLVSLIPDARTDYVNAICGQFSTLAEINAHAQYAKTHDNYPRVVNALARRFVTLLRNRRLHRGPEHEYRFEQLLQYHLPADQQLPSEPQGGSEMYKKLLEIFPDAQRDFLQTQSAMFSNEEDSKKFILRCLAYRDYPLKAVSPDKVGQDPINKADAVERHARLLALLPDADPSYIVHMSATLESLQEIESFAVKAAAEKNYPKKRGTRKRRLSDPGEIPLEPRFRSLKEMLPDADPEYLERAAKKMKSDEDVESFVLNAVEAKNYPRMDAYLKRRGYQDMWMKYIQDFSIEEYLSLFPDPVGYFYFEKKGSKNMPSKFILHRYSLKNVKYVNSVYEEMKYSISKMCDRLDYEFSVIPKKYYEWDGSTEFDVTVLQEIAFIQNKREIAHYILARMTQKELAFNQAKEKGELVECTCCYDDVLQEDIATCPEGHIFCVNCIKRGSDVSIGEGKTSFPCYNDACDAEFSFDLLKNVLRPDVFSRLLARKQYEEVKAAGIPGLETCPFCEFCSVPDAADKVFRCLNPLCMKISCRNCKKVEHLPFTCEESAAREETENKMKKYIEEKMTEALIRTCYNCHAKFIKENGCNLMTCKCGAKMCYMCNEPVTGYHHFDRGACELYVSKTTLHVTNVIEEGRKAKRDVEAANPGIRLTEDPTAGPSSSS